MKSLQEIRQAQQQNNAMQQQARQVLMQLEQEMYRLQGEERIVMEIENPRATTKPTDEQRKLAKEMSKDLKKEEKLNKKNTPFKINLGKNKRPSEEAPAK